MTEGAKENLPRGAARLPRSNTRAGRNGDTDRIDSGHRLAAEHERARASTSEYGAETDAWGKQGRLEGQAAILERQLTKKFCSVPAWAQDRLRNATAGELETWANRILTADNVETVFGQ